MITPSLEELLDKVDSKYTLVVAAAKRARQIIEENKNDIRQDQALKAVSLALVDIAEGRVVVESKQ
ncbi:MAG TPA: DNA-directed RNA polymerase subunit omega [Bacillota bacterium]